MKRKAWLLLVFLVPFFHLILVSSTGATTRIMPLGDSITQGAASGEPDPDLLVGYRLALWQMLIAGDYDVDFVGSLNSGSAIEGFDPDHEGHPGWTDDGIVDGDPSDPAVGELDQWLVDHQPDILLLHIGTNGLVDPVSPDDVERILDVIDDYETNFAVDVWVILARIINRLDHVCPLDSTTTRFNNSVEAMAQDRIDNPANPAYPDNIKIVNIECGAGLDYRHKDDGGDMENTLHPYQYGAGYDKMAGVWFDALKDILQVSIPFSPTVTTSPKTTAYVGFTYNYNVVATGSPAPNYSLSTFPEGMTIDATSGRIEWIPTDLGAFTVIVEASNGVSPDATQSFTVDVNELGTLISGESQSGSVSQGEWVYYHIDATSSDAKIEVELTNLSNDVDLYVREGSMPTLNDYACRPYKGGTTSETCTLVNSGDTTWYIGVYGYSSGSFTITATLSSGGDVTTLNSGESVSDSVSQGEWIYYHIDATSSDAKIEVELTNLSNDVDLYVREGSMPTLNDYACRPYKGGTTSETCTLVNSGNTTWYIGVYGYSSGSFTITATLSSGGDVTTLNSGESVSDSVSQGEWIYYHIDATSSDAKIEVELTNLSNDVDLYVREGSMPTLNDYACRPYKGGTTSETCTLVNSGNTTWYIGVYGYSSGSFTITATLTTGNSGITPLISGQSQSDSVSQGEWVYYHIDATSSDAKIEVELTNLSNDVDLYVREGSMPTLNDYACRPYKGGTTSETCTLVNSGDTTWYIGVNGYLSGSFTITATLSVGGNPGDPCATGKVYDCVGNCIDEATAQSWIGDGYCDDGTWGMDLRCDAFDNDDGDCD